MASERCEGDHLERVATYVSGPEAMPDTEEALRRLDGALDAGFEGLLAFHRRRWAERWDCADIRIEGDDELQRLVRFALFHLMASAPESGEAVVGARGLTGPAYRGHVFWDADVFVLPFLAATNAPAARAMLEYRIRRLGAARQSAAEHGRAGARFPWESAGSGSDVTPSHAYDHFGRVVPIRTGELEEHIVADVAWAAAMLHRLDRRPGLRARARPGAPRRDGAILGVARPVRPGRAAHIYGVIGPDEYHEPVDDNAFTNVMARWNLRRAAATAEGVVPDEERRRWTELAAALVDGFDS